eukprot:TRINITY_DN16794_c0_g1_i1.p1 TRINITY_DN16794_c0_g1~~TRINITY_DN16794_c0_g1_i1.p1  ORF type:complete len:707 (+),score=142.05 TRINITY_DN16794_c0_g1_i1:233-2122(+)
MFIAGVFCGHPPTSVSHRAAVSSPIKLKMLTGYQKVIHALHIKNGMFIDRFTLNDNSTLEIRYYAHRAMNSLLVTDFIWTGSSDTKTIQFETPSPQTSSCFMSPIVNSTKVSNQNVTTWTAVTNGTEDGVSPVTASISYVVGVQNVVLTNNKVWSNVATFRTSLDSDQPALDSLKDWELAQHQELEGSHKSEWLKLWTGGFETDRFDVARAFNTSMYFIMSSVREDVIHSLSPGGLASEGYNGHTFWDCETWMYPAMLLFQPTIAASLLKYRFDRIPTAAKKAASAGYKGTNFPWESATSGEEVCAPNFPEGRLEQHINGDIAFAIRQYFYMTKDVEWLKNIGFPLLEGIANFWCSRVTLDSSGAAHINGVMPPDEFSVNKNDSIFTNYGAVSTLQFASDAQQILTNKTNTQWLDVASRIVLPTYSHTLNMSIHPEYDGYDGQTIKQADAILLGFPFHMNMSKELRKNDLNYYLNKTSSHGPAMTWGMYCVGFFEVGDVEKADSTFNRSFANVKEPYQVWTETPTGGTVNFITGAGGWLQTALFGYSLLRIRSDSIDINPTLIPQSSINKIRSLHYETAIIDFTITHQSLTISVVNNIEIQITTTATGKTSTTSTSVTMPLAAYSIRIA